MGISAGLGGGALTPEGLSFRNVIINGNFMVNQRVYTSGSNLASGAYGFDRWKSNFTNTSLTFTSAPQGQTVTISASGVIRQIVERANIKAGLYVLSWTGTALGRVYNDGSTAPAYQSGPFSVVLDGLANVIVEFTPASGTATLGEVQLEFGSRATRFEHRLVGVELALCQRYYEKSYNLAVALGTVTSNGMQSQFYGSFSGIHRTTCYFKVTKRVAPTWRPYSPTNGTIDNINIEGFGNTAFGAIISESSAMAQVGIVSGSGIQYHWTADAEL